MEYKMGDKSVCKSCGRPIEYVGPYWRHVGKEYRHVAEPIVSKDTTHEAEQPLDKTEV